MPTYAYACTTCDHRFEAQQAFADDALTECPECTGRLRKLFNAVGIVFKGSGFYRTDSRKSSTSAASSGAPAKASDAPGGGGSADSRSSTSSGSGSSSSASSGSASSAGSSGSSTGSGSAGGSSTAA